MILHHRLSDFTYPGKWIHTVNQVIPHYQLRHFTCSSLMESSCRNESRGGVQVRIFPVSHADWKVHTPCKVANTRYSGGIIFRDTWISSIFWGDCNATVLSRSGEVYAVTGWEIHGERSGEGIDKGMAMCCTRLETDRERRWVLFNVWVYSFLTILKRD